MSLAVLHGSADGGRHIHILHARIDLETGLSHNVAPPGHEKAFYALRDHFNYAMGWDRPDDPELARLVQPSHCMEAHQLRDSWAIGEPTSRATAKAQITDYILQKVGSGSVNNRADVVSALTDLSEVTRQGADYLSIKIDGFDKAFRLRGTLFNEQFNSSTYGQNSRKEPPDRSYGSLDSGLDSARLERDRRRADPVHRRLAAAALVRLEAAIASRTEYNTRYYQKRNRDPVPDHQSDDSAHAAAKPDFKTQLDRDGLVVCNPSGLERSADTRATRNRLDTHANESDGRAVSSIEWLGSPHRSPLDSVPVSSGQPQSLQTDTNKIKESAHAPKRDRDDFAEYLERINADYQRAATIARAAARMLHEDRENRLLAAKQRADVVEKIELGRAAYRNTLQNNPDLAILRGYTEGLRGRTGQAGGFSEIFRDIYDRTVAAFGAVHEQLNRIVEKISVGRTRTVVEDHCSSQSVLKPKHSVDSTLVLRPKITPSSDKGNDFNI